MSERRLISFLAITIVMLLALSISIWYTIMLKGGKRDVIISPANVKDVDIVILESFPVQVNVIVQGGLPDSCTEVDKVTQTRESMTFTVIITIRRPSDAMCAQVIGIFEKVIPLDVVGLKKGLYTVEVNGVKGSFGLQTDNTLLNVGILEGKVEVGPLCPVEPCTPTEGQVAQAYAARKIIVYTADRSSIVATVSLDQTGNYKVALHPGGYIVNINKIGIDRSAHLPAEITIKSGKTIRLDIQIDTGIR